MGIGNNIEYEEGKLFLEIPDELDMEGKGLSPKVDVLLKDNGDSFGIGTMSLIDVGVTKSPRKIRSLNSDMTGEPVHLETQILNLWYHKDNLSHLQKILMLLLLYF